jgi:hypothetical protein
MKTLALIFSLILTSTCFAEIYVITDKKTNEVITVSEKNDTIAGQGQEIKVMSGSLQDFTEENPTNYKLSGTKFIKNIDKIDKQEQEKNKQEESAKEEKLIQGKIRQLAIEALKSDGVIIDTKK